ncbi:MAG: signal peptidase II [Planctomycetota bacterium]
MASTVLKVSTDPSVSQESRDSAETAKIGGVSASDDVSPDSQNVAQSSLRPQAMLFATLALAGGIVDLWTKHAIFAWRGLPGDRGIHWVIEGYFGIETAVNIGAVFGIGAGKGTLFAVISVVAAIGILTWLFWFRAAQSWWLTVALGFVGGGIIGNLYDRMGLWWQSGMPEAWRSGVRDWILWQASDDLQWPNFNIADSLLVTGAIMLVIQSWFFPPVSASAPTGDQPDAPIAHD